ncbi:AAA family ATPase [Endozoicomonas sp. ALB115]|uniref:AAA family ATPase n=1 Tax=Endozoicomonas sp. ALB115 TaxID=3403074 RepID=UPI003BB7689D
MLIEFSTTNFRSFRERQTLSMVRGKLKDDDKLDTHSFPFPDKADMALLRSAAIYGANASGKSNLIRALRTMKRVVVQSAGWQRGKELPMEPYLLSTETTREPCEFEASFYANGVRFQYGFSATSERVMEEWLYAYPSGRAQSWIERAWDEGSQSYQWGRMEALKGQKKLWKDSTRDNALLLSTAVQLNCEQLQPVFDWFENTLKIVGINGFNPGFSIKSCEKGERKKEIVNFLKSADLNITDIKVKPKKISANDLPEDMPDDMKQSILQQSEAKAFVDIQIIHEGENGASVALPLQNESDGTRKLFAYAGPWLDVLKEGSVLFIDELHDNLHPLIVRMLVGLFHNSQTNPKNAQLMFTTHETSILSQEVFRRDQVWFASQEGAQGTHLTPLSDFKVRKGAEDIERYYLDGRYGAVPYLPHFYADVSVAMGN